VIDQYQSLRFEHPFSPFFLVSLFLLLMTFFWFQTRGLRQYLARRNYITLFVIQCVIFLGLLFLMTEPTWETTRVSPKQGKLLVLFDASGSTVTRGDSPWRLVYQKNNPFKKHTENFDIEYFLFGDKVRRLETDDVILPPVGEGTETRSAIEALLQHTRVDDDRILLLFSDGQDHMDTASIDALRLGGVPIYTVGLGEMVDPALQKMNVRLDHLEIPDVVPVMSPVKIFGRAVVQGTGAFNLRVILYLGGKKADEQVIQVYRGKKEYEFSFPWTPTLAGKTDVLVQVEEVEGETLTDDNHLLEKVEVLNESRQLLFVRGALNWETRFLLRMLRKHTPYGVHTITLAGSSRVLTNSSFLLKGFPDPDILNSYGCVVLSDVPVDYLSPNNARDLKDFVSKRGGGLLVLGGSQLLTADLRSRPILRKFIPLKLDDIEGSRRRGRVTLKLSERRTHPFFKGLVSNAQELKLEVDELFIPGSVRQGTVPVINLVDPSGVLKEREVALFQRMGMGHIFYSGMSGTWQWYFRSEDDDLKQFYRSFWTQVFSLAMGEVSRKDSGSGEFIVRTSQPLQRVNQPTTITVVTGHTDVIHDAHDISLMVSGPGRADLQVPLQRSVEQSNLFQGIFVPQVPGEYRIEARLSGPRQEYQDSFETTVRSDTREFDSLELNEGFLKRVSSVTGGQYRSWTDYMKRPFEFKRTIERLEKTERAPIWASPLAFWIYLLILGGGWVLRRSINLD